MPPVPIRSACHLSYLPLLDQSIIIISDILASEASLTPSQNIRPIQPAAGPVRAGRPRPRLQKHHQPAAASGRPRPRPIPHLRHPPLRRHRRLRPGPPIPRLPTSIQRRRQRMPHPRLRRHDTRPNPPASGAAAPAPPPASSLPPSPPETAATSSTPPRKCADVP